MNTASNTKRKRTLANFLSLSLLQMANYVLPMITLPIISRVIGPENYGIINYAFAFVGYFVLLINAGFDLYGSRLIAANRESPEEVGKVFSRILAAKTLLLLVASALFSISLFFIPQLQNDKLLALFTFLLCVGWVMNPSWLYHGMQDSRMYAVFSFISKLFFSVVVILVVQERSDYLYHPLITSLAHLLVSVASCYFAMRKYRLSLYGVQWSEIKLTLQENRKLSLIWWVSNSALSTNLVIAGFFLTTLAIGYYSAALRIVIILQSIVAMPLNTVLFPYIGEAFTKSHDQGMERIQRSFPYLVLIAVGTAVITFVFSRQIIIGFYGAEFEEAVSLLRISAAVLFFATLNSAFGQQILLNLKRDNLYMKMVLLGFGLNMLLLLLFVSFMGLAGAAWAWPLSEGLLFIAYFAYFRLKKIQVFHHSYYHPSALFFNFFQLRKLRPSK